MGIFFAEAGLLSPQKMHLFVFCGKSWCTLKCFWKSQWVTACCRQLLWLHWERGAAFVVVGTVTTGKIWNHFTCKSNLWVQVFEKSCILFWNNNSLLSNKENKNSKHFSEVWCNCISFNFASVTITIFFFLYDKHFDVVKEFYYMNIVFILHILWEYQMI